MQLLSKADSVHTSLLWIGCCADMGISTLAVHQPLTAETCSASSLGLPATHKPHAFLTTTCILQRPSSQANLVCCS